MILFYVLFSGSIVKELTATDADFGSNGQISYYIWSGGQDDFTIDSRGRVLVSNRATLDVDEVGMYNMTVSKLFFKKISK